MTELTEYALSLLPLWGPWLLALTTFLSCLALPIPASLLMIAGGAFAATGDVSLTGVALGALIGALLGDQVGFAMGRGAGQLLANRLPASAFEAARARLEGGSGSGFVPIFLSRWLFSALGPAMNLVAGAIRFPHARFTLAAALGEIVWVLCYIGLGLGFGTNLDAAADLASNALGLLATGTVAVILGRWLYRRAKAEPAPLSTPQDPASATDQDPHQEAGSAN